MSLFHIRTRLLPGHPLPALEHERGAASSSLQEPEVPERDEGELHEDLVALRRSIQREVEILVNIGYKYRRRDSYIWKLESYLGIHCEENPAILRDLQERICEWKSCLRFLSLFRWCSCARGGDSSTDILQSCDLVSKKREVGIQW